MRTHLFLFIKNANLVPRVLWLFGQRAGASRDSGVLEFSYRKISAVKQWMPLRGNQSKKLIFFEFSRVSTGAHTRNKKPEDSGYEIARARLCARNYFQLKTFPRLSRDCNCTSLRFPSQLKQHSRSLIDSSLEHLLDYFPR